MPKSYKLFKKEVAAYLNRRITGRVLDIGPGVGTYRHLIHRRFPVDCVEVWQPYVDRYGLRDLYQKVYIADVLNFDDFELYEWVIMGDVLEHIEVDRARALVTRITKMGCKLLVAVPYMFEQGVCEGNRFEVHQQPDLTSRNVIERYQELYHLIGNIKYGYFVNFNPHPS